jgi:prolyl-tRNA editing enzyme YbaK/EbsC (Cys-tRNA(Pro) deacylase)
MPFPRCASAVGSACAATLRPMWPPEVERIAAPLRAAGVEARLEELPRGVDRIPESAARSIGYDCDGGKLVVLVPAHRDADDAKVAAAAGCRVMRRESAPPFPYHGSSRVLVDQLLLATRTVWVHAGSARHVLGLEPAQLARLIRAVRADLVQPR